MSTEKVQLQNYGRFHVREVEKFNWRDLRYFRSTKWKILDGNSTIFDVHGVEKFNTRDLRYFMFTKWKSLTGRVIRYFMFTKWKTIAGVLRIISCKRSGKV